MFTLTTAPGTHPVYEAVESKTSRESILNFLEREDLPDCMTMVYSGCGFVKFHTKADRLYFIMGMKTAFGYLFS